MDKLKEMQAFVAAVERGSLARAADAVGVSPAMLGRRLDALEQRLGVRLLHRSTRQQTLTEEGQLFLERCRRVFAEWRPGGDTGQGACACSCGGAQQFMLDRFADFSRSDEAQA